MAESDRVDVVAKPGLTKKQRRRLGEYVRDIADTLNLRDWQFTILHEPIPSTSDTAARITVTPGRAEGVIEFGAHTADLPSKLLREIVVHELIHCYTSPDKNFYGLDDLIGDPAAHVWRTAWNADMEKATDGLANAVAKLLPLPPDL